jgi:hypothetical protein
MHTLGLGFLFFLYFFLSIIFPLKKNFMRGSSQKKLRKYTEKNRMKLSMDCPLKIKIKRIKSISQICNTLARNQKAVRQEYRMKMP